MTPLAEALTLGFGSGQDLGVVGSGPVLGSVLDMESASTFPSLPSPTHSLE